MFNIGGAEFLVILLVALLVLGPNKLPQAARQVGHFLGEFRRIADGFQQELKTAMDVESPAKPAKPKEKPQSPGGPTDQATVIAAESSEVESVADDTVADESVADYEAASDAVTGDAVDGDAGTPADD